MTPKNIMKEAEKKSNEKSIIEKFSDIVAAYLSTKTDADEIEVVWNFCKESDYFKHLIVTFYRNDRPFTIDEFLQFERIFEKTFNPGKECAPAGVSKASSIERMTWVAVAPAQRKWIMEFGWN